MRAEMSEPFELELYVGCYKALWILWMSFYPLNHLFSPFIFILNQIKLLYSHPHRPHYLGVIIQKEIYFHKTTEG